jgi:GTPase SAR1 family protein
MVIREVKAETSVRLKPATNHNDTVLKGVEAPLPAYNWAGLFIGPPASGKTSLLISLLTQNGAYRKKYNRIYYFSPSVNTLPETFLSKLHSDRIFTDMDALEPVIDDIRASDDKSLIVFDDMVRPLNDKAYKKVVQDLMNNRRHIGGGVSIAIVSQKLKSVPLPIRTAIDVCYFFSLRNRREINDLFADITSSFLSTGEWEEIIQYCAKEPYCFLFIDLRNGKIHKRFNELVLS